MAILAEVPYGEVYFLCNGLHRIEFPDQNPIKIICGGFTVNK